MGMYIIIYKILPDNEITSEDYIEILTQNETEDGFKIFEKYPHETTEDNIIDEEKIKEFGEYKDSGWNGLFESEEDYIWEFVKDGEIISYSDKEMPYKTVKAISVKAKLLTNVKIWYDFSEFDDTNKSVNFIPEKHPFVTNPPIYFENINGIDVIVNMLKNETLINKLKEIKKQFENQDVIVRNSW